MLWGAREKQSGIEEDLMGRTKSSDLGRTKSAGVRGSKEVSCL